MDENNIFLLDQYDVRFNKHDNYENVKKEIIAILKNNGYSIGDAAWLFKGIMTTLGNTPMNQL